MRWFSLIILIFFIFPSFLCGQEQDTKTADNPKPFPLGPILVTALQKKVSWKPDWALPIPPDAFSVSSGQPVSITLTMSGDRQDEEKYRIRWDPKGFLQEFPVLVQGVFVQAQALYNASNTIRGFIISSGDMPMQIDFIGKEVPLSLARVIQDEQVYFVALRYDPLAIAETWYDQAGTALANFTSRSQYAGGNLQFLTLVSRYENEETTEWYHYDSFGNISEIQRPDGIFSALYAQEQYPRYWKQRTISGIAEILQNYTLQWDEQGLLVRISKTPYPDDADWLELRYEYTLDRRGNWIERREIRMIRHLGVLVSSSGATVKREITY